MGAGGDNSRRPADVARDDSIARRAVGEISRSRVLESYPGVLVGDLGAHCVGLEIDRGDDIVGAIDTLGMP